MKNNQNVIIAIALSFLIIVAWQFFVIGPKMEAERKRLAAEQSQSVTPGDDRRRRLPATGAGNVRTRRRPARPAPRRPAGAAAPAAVSRDAALARTDARDDRHAVAERLDQSRRRADRRPAARRLPRDGRPNEPAGRALLAGRHREPLLRRFRLGRGARTGRRFRPLTTEWKAEGGPLVARPRRDAHLGQRRRACLQADLFGRREATCSRSSRRSRTRPARRSTLYPLRPRQPHRRCPRRSGYYILHEGLIGYLGKDGLQEIKYKKLTDEAVDHARQGLRRAGSASPTNTGARR